MIGLNGISQQNEKEIHLVKKKKNITIKSGWIGLKSISDSIKYFGEEKLSYAILKITSDSLYLSKPRVFHYDTTTIVRHGYVSEYFESSRYLDSFRKDGRKFAVYIVIDTFEYKTIAIDDLISIEYPPEASNTTGCTVCIFFPIIPGVNIWFYRKMRRRRHPKTFDLNDWELKIE